MRPTALTFVISVITSAAAPSENEPRCIKCQSQAEPSVELYWHIGETTTRFGNVNPRRVMGENNALIEAISLCVVKGGREGGSGQNSHAARATPSPSDERLALQPCS